MTIQSIIEVCRCLLSSHSTYGYSRDPSRPDHILAIEIQNMGINLSGFHFRMPRQFLNPAHELHPVGDLVLRIRPAKSSTDEFFNDGGSATDTP